MPAYVVTEGEFDAAVLECVLGQHYATDSFKVVNARGKANGSSLARSLLARRGEPVVLALDAAAVDAQLVMEQSSNYRYSLGMVEDPALFWVELFVPEIECIFLTPGMVSRLFEAKLSATQRVTAKYAPKVVLEGLLEKYWATRNRWSLIDELTEEEWKVVGKHVHMRNIMQFLDG